VKYIRYDIHQDWTGDWAVYFKVMLSDEVCLTGVSAIARRVENQTMDRLDIPNLGMYPHFNFRLESEQAILKNPKWDPPRSTKDCRAGEWHSRTTCWSRRIISPISTRRAQTGESSPGGLNRLLRTVPSVDR
jgi:hypothetical protein